MLAHPGGYTRALVGLMVLAIGLVSACAPAAPPTPTPAPPKPAAPAPTVAPAVVAKPGPGGTPPAPTAVAKPGPGGTAPAPTIAAKPTAPAAAKPAEPAFQKVSLRIEWFASGAHAPFYAAVDKGFYEQEGLFVDILEGSGSGRTLQLIANKNEMVGYVDAKVMIQGALQGMQVAMVAAIQRKNPDAVMFLQESGIKAPKDLEGKKVGQASGSATSNAWLPFLKVAGVDASKVTSISTAAEALNVALLEKKIDAYTANPVTAVPLEKLGKKWGYLYFSDYGLPSLGKGLIVHRDLIKDRSDLLRRFLKATVRGWEWSRDNPNETITLLVNRFPRTMDKDDTLRQLKLTSELLETPRSKGLPTGRMAMGEWEETQKVLMEGGSIKTTMPVEQFFTNDYLPK